MTQKSQEHKVICKLQGAWLITWEWIGDHAKPSKKVVSIINSHATAEWVKRYIEQVYADQKYSLSEQCGHAKPKRQRFNPYPAEIFGGYYENPHIRITCGHNPSLLARKVKNLKVINLGGRHEALECHEYNHSQKRWIRQTYR